MPYHSAAHMVHILATNRLSTSRHLYSTSYIANGPFSLPGTLLARPVHFSQPKLYRAVLFWLRKLYRPVQFLRDTPYTGPDLGGGGGGGGGGNRGGCPGPTAFEGAPMVLIIMIFMFFWFIVTRSKLLICVNSAS